MTKLKTSTYRQPTGWLRQRLSRRNIQALDATGLVDDELWILLEYQSEVEDVGLKFVVQNGVDKRNAKKVFKHFQAYVRQAKNYYYSAKKLQPRSAGLLYYYCFLNLAKAALVLKQPAIAGRKIKHGASCLPKDFSKLKKQTVRVLNDGGVFPKLYEWYFGTAIKPQSLNIQRLLNYCTDISYQSQLAGFGNCKMLLGFYVVQVTDSQNPHTGWPTIGIGDFKQCSSYKKSFQVLFGDFDETSLPKMAGKEYFDIEPASLNSFTFFQSKQPINWPSANVLPALESRDLVLKALGNMLCTNYFRSNFDYYVALPYSPQNQIPMDETIAIYLIMFYMSNLVRYNPSYLEELLSKKEAWIIDSFIRTCPPTFLRSMISRIVNVDYVIGGR